MVYPVGVRHHGRHPLRGRQQGRVRQLGSGVLLEFAGWVGFFGAVQDIRAELCRNIGKFLRSPTHSNRSVRECLEQVRSVQVLRHKHRGRGPQLDSHLGGRGRQWESGTLG